MGGFFGVASKQDCVFDLFFGIDYHSHLGTRRGGMAVYGKDGFNRAIHNIENAPFRTKFDKDVQEMSGHMGIGCISDYEPQPLIVRSHHGTYALTTVSKINNTGELTKMLFKNGHSHFLEMSGGDINATELIAALINQKENLIEGIQFALDSVEGSVSILLMNQAGIYAARDKYGRTPVVIGKKEDAYCITFENFAYKNLGYKDYKELGPGEIAVVTDKNCITLVNPNKEMKICTFLWVYYGYPSSSYEGTSVEQMRYNCGKAMAKRDNVKPDIVAGVPDSGIAHAIGAKFHIPHGRANAMLLPHVIEYNSGINKHSRSQSHYPKCVEKYVNVAKLLGVNNFNEITTVRALVSWIQFMLKEMNVPVSVSQCGVDRTEYFNAIDSMAEKALADACTATNPRVPTKEEVVQILEHLYE